MNQQTQDQTGHEIESEAIQWLRNRKPFLSMQRIEEACGIPKTTLSQVLAGKVPLIKKHDKSLAAFIHDFENR